MHSFNEPTRQLTEGPPDLLGWRRLRRGATTVVIVGSLALLLASSGRAGAITSVTVTNGTPTVTWTLGPGEANESVEISDSPDLWTPSNCVGSEGCITFADVGGFSHPIAEWAPAPGSINDTTTTSWTAAPTDWLFGNWAYQYLPPGTYYVRVGAWLASWFGCALNNSCPTQGDWSPTYSFTIAKGQAPPTPKPVIPKDSLFVTDSIEGGANQWIKVNVSYVFGQICFTDDPSYPDCFPSPDLTLTVYRLGVARVKLHGHRKTVTTRTPVYRFSDSGINDINSGIMVVPPLVPAPDFIGGARTGTYEIKVTSDLTGNASDFTTFEILGGRLSG